ncbi:MAG TPA: OsmC family protein [Vicinamibacteria bacterium]|jgi:uncharacterized OsmC-like protein
MADPKAIKRSFERQAKAVGLRPSLGQRTVVSKTRLIDGLKCEIEEGPWKLTADLAKEGGGEDQGPTPGVLGRGAFGACLAIGYKLWASKLDVPISNIEVEVHTDVDERGRFGFHDEITAGYQQVRYIVRIESAAPEADVMRVVDMADRHSPYFDNFARALDLRREVKIEARKS